MAAKRRYEDGTFIKLDGELYFIESHQNLFLTLPAVYHCIELSDGSHHQIPYGQEGMSVKSKPTIEDQRSVKFHQNRRDGFQPPRVGELPNTVRKNIRVELANESNIKFLPPLFEFGLDIETFGRENIRGGLDPDAGDIRLIQLFLPQEKLVIIWDLGEFNNHQGYNFIGKELLATKLQDPEVKIAIHNAAFEQSWFLTKLNCYVNGVQDSMLMSQARWAGLNTGFNCAGYFPGSEKGSPHSLKNVVARLWNGEELSKENQLYDYGLPLGYEQYEYAAIDAIATYYAAQKLSTHERGVRGFRPDGSQYFINNLTYVYNAENAATTALAEMHHRGIPVNKSKLDKLISTYTEQAKIIHDRWLPRYQQSDEIENLPKFWRSRDMKQYFEKKYDFTLASLDRKDIAQAASLHEEIAEFMLWKSLDKNVKDFLSYKDSLQVVNGFTVLRPNYTQLGKEGTGRTTSNNPNCQNFSKLSETKEKLNLKAFKTCLEAPPGFKWLIIDLEGSHAQIARFASGDRKLLEALHKQIKVHFYTVAGMYLLETGHVVTPHDLKAAKKDKTHPLAQIISQYYDPSKTVFYGFLNLQGKRTLQGTLNKSGIFKSLEECQAYIEAIRATYPELYQYLLEVISKANSFNLRPRFTNTDKQQYFLKGKYGKLTCTGDFGLTLSLDGGHQYIEKSRSYRGYGVSGTKAVANAWQRTEATIVKQALGEIHNLIHTEKYTAWLAELTHDEVGLIVKEGQAEDLAVKVNAIITRNFRKFVPDYDPGILKFEDVIGDSWGELK